MKTRFLKKLLIVSIFILSGSASQAGGFLCKECPAESKNCVPLNCGNSDGDIYDIENGICPSASASECRGKAIDGKCITNHKSGKCHLMPPMAGSFCLCRTAAD